MMFPKAKIVRHHGEALRRLVYDVFARDRHSCIVCKKWVEDGIKPHHEWAGNGRKSDSLDKMVLLCNECHYERHHGKRSAEIRRICREYLEARYETDNN